MASPPWRATERSPALQRWVGGYGDNLDVLRRYVKDESVDLIYLDPPFNSRQDYNVLFAEKDGTRSASQIMAFEDTWEWNIDAERSYQEVVEAGGRVADAMRAFRTFLGNSDMMAYLAMMAPRLVELKRVLRGAGDRAWIPSRAHSDGAGLRAEGQVQAGAGRFGSASCPQAGAGCHPLVLWGTGRTPWRRREGCGGVGVLRLGASPALAPRSG